MTLRYWVFLQAAAPDRFPLLSDNSNPDESVTTEFFLSDNPTGFLLWSCYNKSTSWTCWTRWRFIIFTKIIRLVIHKWSAIIGDTSRQPGLNIIKGQVKVKCQTSITALMHREWINFGHEREKKNTHMKPRSWQSGQHRRSHAVLHLQQTWNIKTYNCLL